MSINKYLIVLNNIIKNRSNFYSYRNQCMLTVFSYYWIMWKIICMHSMLMLFPNYNLDKTELFLWCSVWLSTLCLYWHLIFRNYFLIMSPKCNACWIYFDCIKKDSSSGVCAECKKCGHELQDIIEWMKTDVYLHTNVCKSNDYSKLKARDIKNY